jgi:hypothetical protein
MKALFKAVCYKCHALKPRCASVVLFNEVPFVERALCETCRRTYAGAFSLNAQHVPVKRAKP